MGACVLGKDSIPRVWLGCVSLCTRTCLCVCVGRTKRCFPGRRQHPGGGQRLKARVEDMYAQVETPGPHRLTPRALENLGLALPLQGLVSSLALPPPAPGGRPPTVTPHSPQRPGPLPASGHPPLKPMASRPPSLTPLWSEG